MQLATRIAVCVAIAVGQLVWLDAAFAALTVDEAAELVANMDCKDAAQRGNSVNEADALGIAEEAVSKMGLRGFDRTKSHAKRDECGWRVYIYRGSLSPGDELFVRINGQGKVLAIDRGL